MMPERPGPSIDGYKWICHALLPSASVRRLEQELGGARHDLRTRDVGQLGHPTLDTDVELWVHPEDWGRVGPAVMGLLASS